MGVSRLVYSGNPAVIVEKTQDVGIPSMNWYIPRKENIIQNL